MSIVLKKMIHFLLFKGKVHGSSFPFIYIMLFMLPSIMNVNRKMSIFIENGKVSYSYIYCIYNINNSISLPKMSYLNNLAIIF